MKTDRLTQILLATVAVLLLLNLAFNFFSSPAVAVSNLTDVGRYQVSSWGAEAGSGFRASGYYIIDTTTGAVIDSRSEVHGSRAEKFAPPPSQRTFK